MMRSTPQKSEARPGQSSRRAARSGWAQHGLRIGPHVNNQPQETVAHLVRVLGAPSDLFRWVGIELIVRRVVKVCDPDDARTPRQCDRRGKFVAELPCKVEFALEHGF